MPPHATLIERFDAAVSITICTTVVVAEDHDIEVLASASKLHSQFFGFTLAHRSVEVVDVEVEVVAQKVVAVSMVDGEHTNGIRKAELITRAEGSTLTEGLDTTMGIAEPATVGMAPHDYWILLAIAGVADVDLKRFLLAKPRNVHLVEVEVVSINFVAVGMVNIKDIDARNLEHEVTLLPITGTSLWITATMGIAIAAVGMAPHADCALLAGTRVPELRDEVITIKQLWVVGLLEVKVRAVVSVCVCNALHLDHGEELVAHLEHARFAKGLATAVSVSAGTAIRVGPDTQVNGLACS